MAIDKIKFKMFFNHIQRNEFDEIDNLFDSQSKSIILGNANLISIYRPK